MTDRDKRMAKSREMGKARIALFTILLATGRKFTANQLQDVAKNRFGNVVDRRTIYRDIEAISRVMPIESTTGRYGGYQMMDVKGRCRDGN